MKERNKKRGRGGKIRNPENSRLTQYGERRGRKSRGEGEVNSNSRLLLKGEKKNRREKRHEL